MSGTRRPRRGTTPGQPRIEKDGSGQNDPQRTGLRRLCPDLPIIDESARAIRAPAALLAPGATPGNGDPVNKGPPRLAAGPFPSQERARAYVSAWSSSWI